MHVNRDLFGQIQRKAHLEALMLWGPRQVGKTTMLDRMPLKSRLFLDDLALRLRAQSDPALCLDGFALPCLIDEVQYAPQLFPEIKLRIDRVRRTSLKENTKRRPTQYFLTGSNKLMLDRNVKESLAGRCHLFVLHGFSVHEVRAAFPETDVKTLLFKGGFPELYTNPELSVVQYLNDYILSFLEKDIAQSAGVQKLYEFQNCLKLLAARSGQYLNISELANAANIDQKTAQSWIDSLERNYILRCIPTYSTNLSKRVVKMKKLYFYDTGLCARLQSQSTADSLWNSIQAGPLFETLVFSEITKTQDHFLQDWQLYTWRTKDQDEIDFIIKTSEKTFLIEAKLAVQNIKRFELDREAQKVFKGPQKKIIVGAGGEMQNIAQDIEFVPIQSLAQYLLEQL